MVAAGTMTDQVKPDKPGFGKLLKQQRLAAWQPILTAGTVLPAIFLIGLVFMPLGGALLYFSLSVSYHLRFILPYF